MKLQKRKYEELAVKNLSTDLRISKRVLAVSPTGSGKTVIASMLLAGNLRWKKVLWLAHRYELVDQAYKTLVDLGVEAGISMAHEESLSSDRIDPLARVQVASVQTISARGVPKGIDLIIFDEAHRVMADSYQSISESCGSAEVLGLTATPCRMDGRGLGNYFAKMRVLAKQTDLQTQGFLSRPRTFSAPPEVLEALDSTLIGVKSIGGDYSPSHLARAIDKRSLIGKVVSESIRLAPRIPKLVFACSVKHSKKLCYEYLRNGVAAMHLDGTTPTVERQDILDKLRGGEIEVVCNVDVLSEGWDLPSLGAVVVARPTRSISKFLQMVGRGSRSHLDNSTIIIDHGANVQRLDVLPGEDIDWTLEHGVPVLSDEEHVLRLCDSCGSVMERGETICEFCGQEHEYIKTRSEERAEIDLELEEITKLDMALLRARIEKVAEKVGASGAWIDSVAGAVVSA